MKTKRATTKRLAALSKRGMLRLPLKKGYLPPIKPLKTKGKPASEIIIEDKETLELLSIPGFLEECKKGLAEIRAGGGKALSELDIVLRRDVYRQRQKKQKGEKYGKPH